MKDTRERIRAAERRLNILRDFFSSKDPNCGKISTILHKVEKRKLEKELTRLKEKENG